MVKSSSKRNFHYNQGTLQSDRADYTVNLSRGRLQQETKGNLLHSSHLIGNILRLDRLFHKPAKHQQPGLQKWEGRKKEYRFHYFEANSRPGMLNIHHCLILSRSNKSYRTVCSRFHSKKIRKHSCSIGWKRAQSSLHSRDHISCRFLNYNSTLFRIDIPLRGLLIVYRIIWSNCLLMWCSSHWQKWGLFLECRWYLS